MDPGADRSTGVTATTATVPATATEAFDFADLYRETRATSTPTWRRWCATARRPRTSWPRRSSARTSGARFDARRGTPRAWLFGIARNAALDELRRRKRSADAGPGPLDGAAAPTRRPSSPPARHRPRRARHARPARPRARRPEVPRRPDQRRDRARARRQPDERRHPPAPRHDQAPGGLRCLNSRCTSATPAPSPTRPWAAELDGASRPASRARRRAGRPAARAARPLLALGAVARPRPLLVVLVIAGAVDRAAATSEEPAQRRAAAAAPTPGRAASRRRRRERAPAAPADSRPRRRGAGRRSGPARAAHERAASSSASVARALRRTPDEFARGHRRAIRVVDALGGYVQSSRGRRRGSRASAT